MLKIRLEEMNHFVLCKQHLTDDTKCDDAAQIARDICGLHSTGSTTPYLSLFVRSNKFSKEDLENELYSKKTLGKIRCVRGTVYTFPKEMIGVAFSATKRMFEPASEKYAKFLGVTKQKYEEMSKQVLKLLKGCTMSAAEVKAKLQTEMNVSAVLNLMCDQGLLIRAKPKGGWKKQRSHIPPVQRAFP